MAEEHSFFTFLGQLIFTPEHSNWSGLTLEQQRAFCQQAQDAHLEPLFARCLGNQLPVEYASAFRDIYQKESFKRLIESHQLPKLYSLLKQEKIPFVPLKGADLAFRLYPDQVLRPHTDWDILFFPEDCQKVLRILLSHGWSTFTGLGMNLQCHHHHYERLHHEKQVIEVHQAFPNNNQITLHDIWDETIEVDAFHRVLSPEMNLLLLSAHASSGLFEHLSCWKILLDAAFILKHDPIDWDKVHILADRLHLLRPDILLSAWSEFFPRYLLPESPFVPEQQKLLRETFDMHEKLSTTPPFEKTMTAGKVFGFTWLCRRLCFYRSFASIGAKYHIQSNQKHKIIWVGLKDFSRKARYLLCQYHRQNQELKTYYQNVQKIELLIRSSTNINNKES